MVEVVLNTIKKKKLRCKTKVAFKIVINTKLKLYYMHEDIN